MTVDWATVEPLTVTVSVSVKVSGFGWVIVRVGPVEGSGLVAATGEGDAWACFCCRAVRAVYIPKVIKSPIPNPMTMANKTSFFIYLVRLR